MGKQCRAMESLEMNSSFWHGRRVFLTGHTGFKGSWLSIWLQQLGVRLTGYSLDPPTSPSLFEEARVANGMSSLFGDVRDLSSLTDAMRAAQPEIVIHMAAQPLVRYSYDQPVETYATNVMGTVHLLEAVRNSPQVRAVVVVTTDKCYENREWVWGYRENEPMGGSDPYSNSKGCAELVCSAYRDSYFNVKDYSRHGVAVATARAGNVIGGGDWAKDRLIPDVIAAFESRRPVVIRHPAAIRPWQHVLEPLRGYMMLAERLYDAGPSFAQAWNFGPVDDDARPVSWIVDRMADRWGDGARWELDSCAHPHEANMLKLDISKAGAVLGWKPKMRLDQALQLVVDWAAKRREGADVRQMTLSQIADYQALLKE